MSVMFAGHASLRGFRVALGFALAFWIAGFGCIFGCESLAMPGSHSESITAAQPETSPETSRASCPRHIDHSCCTRRASSSQKKSVSPPALTTTTTTVTELVGESVRECPMAINATALGTRSRPHEVTATMAVNVLDVRLVSANPVSPFSHPSFLYNRGSTYLRCCTFLI